MTKYTGYTNTDPIGTDVIGLSRSPFTINTFFSTTLDQLKVLVEPIEANEQLVFGTGTGISSSSELKWDGSSLLIDGGITVETMTTAGVVHNSASGVFSSSQIVAADIQTASITGVQIAPNTIGNSNLYAMTPNTIKGNDTEDPANPTDLTPAEVRELLEITGTITMADNQVGYGSGTNIVGNNVFTFDESALKLLISGVELNFGTSASIRQLVLYDAISPPNAHQYYGINIGSNELKYHTDQAASDHIFLSGTTSTTSLECARIKGNGKVSIGAGAIGSKSIFQIFSTTLGSVPFPKMTTTQMNAITSPDEGSGVYDVTTHQFKGYNGSSWAVLG